MKNTPFAEEAGDSNRFPLFSESFAPGSHYPFHARETARRRRRAPSHHGAAEEYN